MSIRMSFISELALSHEQVEFDELLNSDKASLKAIQLSRLKISLHHAYNNVPHYAKIFDEAGVCLDDIKSLKDIEKLPFTQKSDLRDHYPFSLFAIHMKDVVRVHASSGTSGKPTVVGYSQNDINTWASVMTRSMLVAGAKSSDMVHIAYGYGLFTGGLGAHYGAEKLGCTVIPMSGGQTSKQAQLIKDFDPDIIMVTPSYMLNLADELDSQKTDIKNRRLRLGIFGAEPWSLNMRKELEQRLGIDALDIYGLSEVIGPGVAMETLKDKKGGHSGPTIWEDHFYPEIINPDTGDIVEEGIYGELVFTSLTKEAMPIIRYRTGDITRFLPPTTTPMRRMDKIIGRSDDMLIIRGVNVFPSQIEEQLLKLDALTPHYEIEVYKEGHLNGLIVRCELKPEACDFNQSEKTQVSKALQALVKDYIGISIKVELVLGQGIKRSQGKAQRIIHQSLLEK